jgi:hypothetical protein
MNTLSHMTAAHFTQLDYDREMVLILTEPGIPGKTEIYGDVLNDNHTMLKLCRVLGFSQQAAPDDPGFARVTLNLSEQSGLDVPMQK